MASINLPNMGGGGGQVRAQSQPKRTAIDYILDGLRIAQGAYGLYADTKKISALEEQSKLNKVQQESAELSLAEQKQLSQGQLPSRMLLEQKLAGRTRESQPGEQGVGFLVAPTQPGGGPTPTQLSFPRDAANLSDLALSKERLQFQKDALAQRGVESQNKQEFYDKKLALQSEKIALDKSKSTASNENKKTDRLAADLAKSNEENYKKIERLRREYNASDVTKYSNIRLMQHGTLTAFPTKLEDGRSASDDLSLIFSYMKILDPTSTVRETEFANAENAAGVDDRIRNMYNKVKLGTRLSDDQVGDYKVSAGRIKDAQLKQQSYLDSRYATIAQRIDPNIQLDLVLDPSFGNIPPRVQTAAPSQPGQALAPAAAPTQPGQQPAPVPTPVIDAVKKLSPQLQQQMSEDLQDYNDLKRINPNNPALGQMRQVISQKYGIQVGGQ